MGGILGWRTVSAAPENKSIVPQYQEGAYLHDCPAVGWHIDETCNEFIRCRCFQPTPEILEIQDRLAVAMDAKRGNIGP